MLAVSWLFMPSTYTHKEGQRVSQYSEPPKAYAQPGHMETLHFSDEYNYLHGAESWKSDHWYNRAYSQ